MGYSLGADPKRRLASVPRPVLGRAPVVPPRAQSVGSLVRFFSQCSPGSQSSLPRRSVASGDRSPSIHLVAARSPSIHLFIAPSTPTLSASPLISRAPANPSALTMQVKAAIANGTLKAPGRPESPKAKTDEELRTELFEAIKKSLCHQNMLAWWSRKAWKSGTVQFKDQDLTTSTGPQGYCDLVNCVPYGDTGRPGFAIQKMQGKMALALGERKNFFSDLFCCCKNLMPITRSTEVDAYYKLIAGILMGTREEIIASTARVNQWTESTARNNRLNLNAGEVLDPIDTSEDTSVDLSFDVLQKTPPPARRLPRNPWSHY